MKRELYQYLVKWKTSEKRKPLLLQGARQTGKTYLVNEFGKKEYRQFVTLNFEQAPKLKTLFQGDLSPQTILENIALYTGQKILPQELKKLCRQIPTQMGFQGLSPKFYSIR